MPSFKDTNNVTYTSRDIADKLINTPLSGLQGQDLVLIFRQNTSQTGSVLMSNILDRATHTGSQAISTINNLQPTLDGKITNIYTKQGSLIKSNSLNQPEELKIGTIGQILTSDGTNPLWLNIPISSESSQGIITIANQVETNTGTNDEKAITPLKLRNSSLATTTQKGVTQLATQTEYFNKDNTKTVTAENIANDVRQASFSIVNKSYNGTQQTDFGDSATWLPIAAPQLIPTGDETLDGTGVFVPGLNLLGTMLSVNETNADLVDYTGFEFKDTTNTLLNGNGKWFNDTDKKWLAPSPLNTFNQGSNKKLFFRIRIPEFMITTQNSFAGNAMYVYIRLLRYNFNAQDRKIISQIPVVLSEINATSNIPYTFLYSTNIKGETDPFVSAGDGFYMDIIKSNKSSAGGGNPVYLRHVRIDIERN